MHLKTDVLSKEENSISNLTSAPSDLFKDKIKLVGYRLSISTVWAVGNTYRQVQNLPTQQLRCWRRGMLIAFTRWPRRCFDLACKPSTMEALRRRRIRLDVNWHMLLSRSFVCCKEPHDQIEQLERHRLRWVDRTPLCEERCSCVRRFRHHSSRVRCSRLGIFSLSY